MVQWDISHNDGLSLPYATPMAAKEQRSCERRAFGGRITSLRKSLRLTQTQLAFLSGIERTHLSRIEHGHCSTSLDEILMLAEVLSIAPALLIDELRIAGK